MCAGAAGENGFDPNVKISKTTPDVKKPDPCPSLIGRSNHNRGFSALAQHLPVIFGQTAANRVPSESGPDFRLRRRLFWLHRVHDLQGVVDLGVVHQTLG